MANPKKVDALAASMQTKLAASQQPPQATPAVHTTPRQSKQTAPDRQDRNGRVSLVTWQPEQARRNLKMMAAAQGRDMQDLMLEALNDLFLKHNMPTVQGD